MGDSTVGKIDDGVRAYYEERAEEIGRTIRGKGPEMPENVETMLVETLKGIHSRSSNAARGEASDLQVSDSYREATSYYAQSAQFLDDFGPSQDLERLFELFSVAAAHEVIACHANGFERRMESEEEGYEDQAIRATANSESSFVRVSNEDCQDIWEQREQIYWMADHLVGDDLLSRPVQFKLGMGYGINDIERLGGELPASSNYGEVHGRFRVHYPLSKTFTGLNQLSGPSFGGEVSSSPGDLNTNTGTLVQFGLMTGWEQYIGNNFYISPKIYAEYSHNRINFGEGYRPPEENSINAGGELSMGVDIPFMWDQGFYIEGGYQVEETIIGNPEYLSHGPFISIGGYTSK